MFKSNVKKIINYVLGKLFKVEIRRKIPELGGRIYKQSRDWDYSFSDIYWVGGKFKVSNFSNGYHGILQQWWEFYNNNNPTCLLISENNKVKGEFKQRYPSWKFATLDFYDNKGEPVDIVADLCSNISDRISMKFDLIVCQATLEHLYNPFKAMENMLSLLNEGGTLVIHTHLPSYYYHPFPRDYFRFHPDWFEDIPLFINNCEMVELYTINGHVFSAYRKH